MCVCVCVQTPLTHTTTSILLASFPIQVRALLTLTLSSDLPVCLSVHLGVEPETAQWTLSSFQHHHLFLGVHVVVFYHEDGSVPQWWWWLLLLLLLHGCQVCKQFCRHGIFLPISGFLLIERSHPPPSPVLSMWSVQHNLRGLLQAHWLG